MAKLSWIIGPRPSDFKTFDEFKGVIKQALDLGFQGVELGLGIPMGFDPDELNEYLHSVNGAVSAVMTWPNTEDGLWLCLQDEDIRKRAVKRLQELIPVVKKLNTTMIIGSMQGRSNHERNRELGKARILECLKQVAETAEKYDQTIVLEPMNHMECGYGYTLEEVMGTIKEIGSKCFKPMLDTIHMNIEEKDMIETIHRAGADLRHVHLCESNARSAGEGHIDYKAVFKALEDIKYDGWVAVKAYQEPWPVNAQKTVKYLKERGILI